ncbi:hypothetical protein [Pseudoalteromonas sp. R3]|uniref:hypothetical protein n=1 Tax=Pseudoalteromonas sp. R3 TaxID=1709477 RepID=UPI0006B683C5|nr:hypothetical protein [Pseudoalteromonas sp. R3]AZZ98832.1 hypothetical protein ELR70_18045 [Pseudoalteromonas sp. R3]
MNLKKVLSIALLSSFPLSGLASDWVTINDMSKLKYQIKDNKVWFRNVNEFDNSWIGCCYAYYLDLSTDEGKAAWSAMLTNIAMGSSYNIAVTDKTVNGSKVTFSGEW